MRVALICVVLCLASVAFAASDSESQGTLNAYSPRNGDPIATTADVAIESDGSSFGAANAEPTFAEDPANVPRRNQMVSHRAPSSPQAQDDSDNPYIVHANKWDPEMMNVRAIARASSGLNDLIKEVNAKIPMFRRKALRDYPDDGVMQQPPAPRAQAPRQQQMDDGPADDEFLEIQTKFVSPIQRLRDRVHQQRRLDDIHASIELELEADASKRIVAGGIEQELDKELMALNSDPQLREWEQEAQWKQQHSDVHNTLQVSDRLLADLKGRYKDETN